jgi:hypothetical protein
MNSVKSIKAQSRLKCQFCGNEKDVYYYWIGGQGDVPMCIDAEACQMRQARLSDLYREYQETLTEGR